MCFQKKTTINQTGLGDKQYKTLQTNQKNLGTQAEEGFTGLDKRFDTVDKSITGIGKDITGLGKTVNENTNTGFTNLSELLSGYGDTLSAGQTAAAEGSKTYYDNLMKSIKNNTGGLATAVDTGFTDMAGRFDTVDQANTDIQSSVNTGFEDQATAFNNLEAGMNTQFENQNTGLTDAFGTLGTDLDTAFTNASDELSNVSSNVLQGQGNLSSSLSDLSANQDTYYGDLAERAGTLQETTDGFQTNFDNFVNRYADDTTLANQTRADILTGQANATTALREDMGRYADATSKGQSNLASRLGDLGEGTAAGFEVLSGAVEGGFSDTAAAAQVERQNLSNRIGNVKSLLEDTGNNIDDATKAQYTALANSFDESGQLIANSIDAQGNTISRSLDEQGNVIESKFDGTGKEISRVSMDVETMLSNAENFQNSLVNQIGDVQQSLDTGVSSIQSGQEGLMSVADNTQAQIQSGFDTTSNTMDTQLRDLARIASSQSDLDMQMRQDFKQIGDSFDDTGQLIQNTVTENGTTISRAIDSNGNLLLRAFDMQGNRIGDKVLNINKSLYDLQNLNSMTGANASMGNLSPAMQGDVPTGGFASPFTTTR